MTPLSVIFVLSVLGIAETAYLIGKRIAMEKPFCPMGGDCDLVLTSKYNHLLGVPNDILGLLSYMAVAAISAALYLGISSVLPLALLLHIIVAMACIMSAVLIYIQWRLIKAWCFWCLISSLTVLIMGAMLLIMKI